MVRRAEVFREKQDINLLTGHWVEAIDPGNRTVSGATADGKPFEFPYDRLLIATGCSAVMPDIPGVELPGVLPVKSLADGRQIKHFLKDNRVQKAVIIGMGYIALEMCETFVHLGIQVDLVKHRPQFLPWLEPSMAQAVRESLESKGVGIHTGHPVKHIDASGKRLQVICSDLTLDGDLVIAAIGVTPNSRLGGTAGLKLSVDRSIAVDRNLRTSDELIYAAGDCADAYHVVTGKKTWIPLALRANRAGWAAADNACGTNAVAFVALGKRDFAVFF